MKAEDMTKDQLIKEVTVLRQRNAELNALVAKRNREEDSLREQRDRAQKYLDIAGVMIVVIDVDQRVTLINKKGCEILGYKEEEIIGKNWFDDFLPEEDRDRVKDVFVKLIAGEIEPVEYFENPVLTESGEERIIAWHNTVLADEAGNIMAALSSGEDITDRKRAEKALQESEDRYRAVVEDLPVLVCSFLPGGEITFVNKTYCEYFGRTSEEFVGATFLSLIPEADRKAVMENISALTAESPTQSHVHKVIAPNGDIRWQRWTNRAVFDAQGRTAGYQSIGEDITGRKQAEEENKKLEAQLLQAQKMEAIGTLAGGIAHDFNNLLQAVQGYAELLLLDKKGDEAGYGKLREIMHTTKRGGELVQQLLTFGRKVESKLRPVDLNHEVEQVRVLLERTIPRMIAIELHLQDRLWTVNADPGQIEQVLMNLAVNAKYAMPDGGKLIIETENVTLSENFCKAHPGARQGDHVLLTISDTGHGMDRQTVERIFEPFYSTKEVGKGTGLGLAMVYGIVKNHDGYILCSSEPRKGTTFKIYLPVIEREAKIVEVTEEDDRIKGGSETILLVDDEVAIREVGEKILSRFGYSVLTAADGESAIELYRKKQEQIDLVILDLVMPGMGGRRCLEELLKIDHRAKVVIASGYSADARTKEAIETGANGLVSKPYVMNQMLQFIREVIDEK